MTMREVARRTPDYVTKEHSRQAMTLLTSRGVPLPSKPEAGAPDVPHELTDLDDRALMNLFSALTEWLSYLSVQLAASEVDEKSDDAALEQHKALSTLANKTEKTVTAARARQYEDEGFLATRERAMQTYAYRKLLSAITANAERDVSLVSRELTRRVGRSDREGRSARWTA